ncbi:MAG: GNAT family N-acetyltransferase [Chitinophagaceae bacterium]|nr:GNAT family N-acetyltransferase [Chitinophagaceae bacterium]
MEWILKKFEALSPHDLYAILQLRNIVFAVEQNCVYPDLDNRDQASYHLMCWSFPASKEEQPVLLAYTRLLPPGLAYEEPSIGRVVTSPFARKTGLGRELMKRSIEHIRTLYGKQPVRIGAQLYLLQFYQSLGFLQTSEIYLEDGIEHVEMLLS